MLESFIHVIKDFFEAVFKITFGEYNRLQSVASFRSFTLDILKVIKNLLFLFLLFVIAEQIHGAYEYFNHCISTHHFNPYKDLSINWFISFCLLVGIPAYYFARLGINKIKNSVHLEHFFLENQKNQIDSIYVQTLSLNNKLSKNHSISYSFFSTWANKQNDYNSFITNLKEATHIEPQDLTSIAELAKSSTYGHFMCVVAYLNFFKDDTEFKEMVNYFSKYEVVASKNKNIVQRVFTIPGLAKSAEESYFKTKWENGEVEKNYYLYCYLVLNKLCACDSYLLVYDETKKEKLNDRFMTNVDYVLAYKNQNEADANKIELFFAYPETSNELNKTIKINDGYFIRMFELDFKKRMELTPSDETPTTFLKFNKSNKNEILEMLHINSNDSTIKQAVNDKLDLMKLQLENNAFFNQNVTHFIEDWKLK